jgi:hypothetical protein
MAAKSAHVTIGDLSKVPSWELKKKRAFTATHHCQRIAVKLESRETLETGPMGEAGGPPAKRDDQMGILKVRPIPPAALGFSR